jgi:hypothetical protein
MAPVTKKLKKKRRPADRDSSDGEAEPAEPAEPVPIAMKKKRAKSDVEDAPEAKKAKVQEETKVAPEAKKAKGQKTEAAKEEKKDANKDGADKVSDAEKEALTKEALAAIEKGLSEKDAQKGGKAFIPTTWASKFKTVLGKYRKFINAQHGYVAIDTEGGNFVVKRASEVGDEASPTNGKWKKLLYNAWIGYCEAVPKAERDFQKFISEIPGRGTKSSPEASTKSKSTSSPQVSPKADPKAAPAPTLKAKKKLKKKTATP